MPESAVELVYNSDAEDSFEQTEQCHILNICFWNANGITRRLDEIKNFLIEENIDVMLLAETHLTDKHNFKIYGYKFYKTQHPDGKARGGTGILIKRSIKHQELDAYKRVYLQATSINLNIGNENITLAAVYCLCHQTAKIEEVQFVKFFDTLGDRFLAVGDYNAKHTLWGSTSIDTRGRKLYNIITSDENALDFISPVEKAFFPADLSKKPNAIDFAIIKGINKNHLTATVIYNLFCDHYPVLYHLLVTPNTAMKLTPKPKLKLASPVTNRLMYRKFIKSHHDTSRLLELEKGFEDADDCAHDFNIMVALAAEIAISKDEESPGKVKLANSYKIERALLEDRRPRKEWQEFKIATHKLWASLQLEKEILKKRRLENMPESNKILKKDIKRYDSLIWWLIGAICCVLLVWAAMGLLKGLSNKNSSKEIEYK